MKLYKIAQVETIGPVYHGTVYQFKPEEIRRDRILFFSDDKMFARDYAGQKSFEAKMDADITVHSYYIKGSMFDPQNKQHVEQIKPHLPEKITVYNDFGMNADLTLDDWEGYLSGTITEKPYWSEEDLKDKKVGDLLPENDTYSRPLKYEILAMDNDKVWYAYAGTIGEVQYGRHAFRWDMESIQQQNYSKEEIANDILHLDPTSFKRKYKDFQRRHDIRAMWRSRHPITTHNNDTWRWLEGNGVFEAIQKAGFNIVKSRERRKTTYAVFPSAEVVPIK